MGSKTRTHLFEVRHALAAREQRLVGLGLAERRDRRLLFARSLLDTLRERELSGAAADIAARTGMAYRAPLAGEPVAGTCSRRLQLASGRFAMVDDGLGFTLVPWTPALERQMGRTISGIARADGGIDWGFGRARSLGL